MNAAHIRASSPGSDNLARSKGTLPSMRGSYRCSLGDQAQGQRSAFLHAQIRAEAFYARLGFVAEGGVFEDAGIPHRCMRAPTGPDSR